MGNPRTRSQAKSKTVPPSKSNDVLEISDDDEAEVKSPLTTITTPLETTQQKQDRTKPEPTIHKTPSGKSKYFPKPTTTQPTASSSNQKTNIEENCRYDIPDELKADEPLPEEKIPINSEPLATTLVNSNGKRHKSLFDKKTLSDDSEEEAPISKKKKPNKQPEKVEPIVIMSISESIPDEDEIISETITTPEKTKDDKIEKVDKIDTLNVEVLTTSPKKDPIDLKIETWSNESKQIVDSYRIACNNLFEEIIDDLQKEWSLKKEHKSQFKQGLELAGKLMINNSQKSRLFYLTLSYYILFENKNIQLIAHLFDPLENMDANPLKVSVDFSCVEFEDICKEYSNKKDVLTLLKKYYSLFLVEKVKRTTTENQTIARCNKFVNILSRQHNEIRKYQAKEKK